MFSNFVLKYFFQVFYLIIFRVSHSSHEASTHGCVGGGGGVEAGAASRAGFVIKVHPTTQEQRQPVGVRPRTTT